VKLIDFAHTKVVPGKGLDEGVLLGMDTILRLLDGRLSELEREHPKHCTRYITGLYFFANLP
jgi:hypothetical protein